MPDENQAESVVRGEAASPPVLPAPTASTAPVRAAPSAARRRRLVRRVLLALGPIAVAAGAGYVYITTGRWVSTDNAYVKADVGIVAAEIAGPIVSVAVRENQPVARGDVLFTIDSAPFRVNLERAEAQLAAIGDHIEGIRVSYRQALEQLELDRTNAVYEEREFERLQTLASRKLASEVDVDEARHKRDVARQEVVVGERDLERIRAQLGGDVARPMAAQPVYLAAKAARDAAALDLEHTAVRAPFDGIASHVPQVGHYASPGAAVMSVVARRGMWIEANYKETDLTHVHAGQRVAIELDTYPGRTWNGIVDSISQATGAEFSVIPAQNATGNWVKVTQRIPVRIAIEAAGGDLELRAGMSAVVAIDTEHERPVPAWLAALRAALVPVATAAAPQPEP